MGEERKRELLLKLIPALCAERGMRMKLDAEAPADELFATFRALASGTCRALYITFGLGQQHTAGEFEFPRLRVNLQELDGHLVTFLDASFFHGLEALPVNLRGV